MSGFLISRVYDSEVQVCWCLRARGLLLVQPIIHSLPPEPSELLGTSRPLDDRWLNGKAGVGHILDVLSADSGRALTASDASAAAAAAPPVWHSAATGWVAAVSRSRKKRSVVEGRWATDVADSVFRLRRVLLSGSPVLSWSWKSSSSSRWTADLPPANCCSAVQLPLLWLHYSMWNLFDSIKHMWLTDLSDWCYSRLHLRWFTLYTGLQAYNRIAEIERDESDDVISW